MPPRSRFGLSASTTSSVRRASTSRCASSSRRPVAAARPSTTSSCTGRLASARRPSHRSSPPRWACRRASRPVRPWSTRACWRRSSPPSTTATCSSSMRCTASTTPSRRPCTRRWRTSPSTSSPGAAPGAQTLRLSLNRFTVIAATTRAGALGGPLRDRFGVTFRLDYYDVDELTDIIRRSARLLKIAIDDEGAALLASRARGTPRVANRLLRRARDYAQVRAAGHIDVAAATAALDMLGVDAAGLDEMDRRVLAALCGPLRGHPVGGADHRRQRAGGARDDRGRRRAVPDPPRHAGAHSARSGPHRPRLRAPRPARCRPVRSAPATPSPRSSPRAAMAVASERDPRRAPALPTDRSTTPCPPSASRRRRWNRATPRGCCTCTPAARSSDHAFTDLPALLRPGDLLVANDTRVRAARLRGAREDGGPAEILLLERSSGERFTALVRPGRRLPQGARVTRRRRAARSPSTAPRPATPARGWSSSSRRRRRGRHRRRRRGAAAAIHPRAAGRRGRATRRCTPPAPPRPPQRPTAGLHFTARVREALAARGVGWATLQLDVGLGTFAPITTADVRRHRMHAERCTLPAETAAAIERNARARAAGSSRSAPPRCARWSRMSTSAGAPRPGELVDGPVHHARLPVPRRRRAGHQLPPAALLAARAAGGLRRRPSGGGAPTPTHWTPATASSASATACCAGAPASRDERLRRRGARWRGAHGPAAHRARRRAHPGVHACRDARHRQDARPRGGARMRRRHPALQRVPPRPATGRRPHRARRRSARVHGLGRTRSSPTAAGSSW